MLGFVASTLQSVGKTGMGLTYLARARYVWELALKLNTSRAAAAATEEIVVVIATVLDSRKLVGVLAQDCLLAR